MPDAAGKFRGITIPRVPWHEKRDQELAEIKEQQRRAKSARKRAKENHGKLRGTS